MHPSNKEKLKRKSTTKTHTQTHLYTTHKIHRQNTLCDCIAFPLICTSNSIQSKLQTQPNQFMQKNLLARSLLDQKRKKTTAAFFIPE